MTTAAPVTRGFRETAIFTYWLYPAIGIPFVILGLWGGFSPAFQGSIGVHVRRDIRRARRMPDRQL
jgi:hypothetical protein